MGSVNFAVFSAANTAAIHLLDSIKPEICITSNSHGNTIRYNLPSQSPDPSVAIAKKELNYPEPDIPLCPPEESPSEGSLTAKIARKFIKYIHAVMHLHPESDVLCSRQTLIEPSFR